MLEQDVTQNVSGNQNIVAGGNLSVYVGQQNVTYEAPHATDQTQLRALLNKVKADWLDGFLRNAVPRDMMLKIDTITHVADIERPWDSIQETLDPSQPVASPAEIVDVFSAAGRALLILGQGGSGKTILLLKLADKLAARAAQDLREPIPTYVSLSQWSEGWGSFLSWLVNEMSSRYQVPRAVGEQWLRQGRLVLLLDGLDEVPPKSQPGCVKAINAFLEQCGASGIVVCCRTGDYQAIGERLHLRSAVALKPLTIDQSLQYVATGGSQMQTLARAMESDKGLQELATSPLMLQIMTTVYQEQPPEPATDDAANAVDPRRRLLGAYIDAVFRRAKSRGAPWSKKRTLLLLRWLADRSLRHAQTIISLERIQPDWLETRGQRCAYILASRVALALLMAFIVVVSRLSDLPYALTVAFFGLPLALAGISRLLFFRGALNRTLSAIASIFGGAISFVVLYGVSSFVLYRETGLVYNGVATWGALYGLFFWLRSKGRNLSDDIRTTEVARWSYRDAWKAAKWWSLRVGSAIGLVVGILRNLRVRAPSAILTNVGVSLLYGVLTVGLVAFFIGGIRATIREGKQVVNQGILLTMRNGVLLAVGIASAFFVICACVRLGIARLSRSSADLAELGPLSADVGIAVWAGYGGIDVLNHYVLRIVAWAIGYMPLRYGRFLEYASRLRILQKAGGSYVFLHRSLAEHLAE